MIFMSNDLFIFFLWDFDLSTNREPLEPQKNMASHLPHLSFTATSLRDAPPLSVDLMLKVLPLSVTMAAVGLLECLGRGRHREDVGQNMEDL